MVLAEWKRIVPTLVSYLQDRLPLLRRVEERAQYRQRLRLLRFAFWFLKQSDRHNALPHPVDICRTSEVRAVAEMVSDDQPLTVSVFDPFLLRLINERRNEQRAELIALSPPLLDAQKESRSHSPSSSTCRISSLDSPPLDLACTVYYCPFCHLTSPSDRPCSNSKRTTKHSVQPLSPEDFEWSHVLTTHVL